MKKILLTIILIIIIFNSKKLAQASTNIDIDNIVKINSNSKIKTNTEITVESNGNITHYKSDKTGSVSVKSVNGKSEIKVNGLSVSNTPKNTYDSPHESKDAIPTMTPKPTQSEKKILGKTNQITNMINEIKEKISIIKNIFTSIFD